MMFESDTSISMFPRKCTNRFISDCEGRVKLLKKKKILRKQSLSVD